jgi:hypothetical protein
LTLSIEIDGGGPSTPAEIGHTPRAAWADVAGSLGTITPSEVVTWSELPSYSPGAGLTLSGTTFAVDPAQTAYAAGAGLVLTGRSFAVNPVAVDYTVGAGLALTGRQLSATGGTYTAGNGVTLTGTTIALNTTVTDARYAPIGSPTRIGFNAAIDGTVPSTCNSGNAGAISYKSGGFYGCNGTNWLRLDAAVDGSTQQSAARSCLAIRDAVAGATTGNYWLDPDGTGSISPFRAWCQMDLASGGWTASLHLVGNGQITGSGRENFWPDGGTLTGYAYAPFTGLESTQRGFIGWNRVAPLVSDGTLDVLVTGTNAAGTVVAGETYTMQNFTFNRSNGVLETGALAGGGLWSIGVDNDSNTRNGWGTCGSSASADTHVGFGLCPRGFDGNDPRQRDVQFWHYGDYTACVNTSFGIATSTSNFTYPCAANSVDAWVFVRE